MSVIGNILQEELERLKEIKKLYRGKMKNLPKGSIQVKKINGKNYPYLVFRKNYQVVTHYLGKLKKQELEDLKKSFAKRKEYEANLKQVEKQIIKLRKMLNVERV